MTAISDRVYSYQSILTFGGQNAVMSSGTEILDFPVVSSLVKEVTSTQE